MDKFNIISAKITGNPDPTGWSQVHEYLPEDLEKLQNRGHLFAVIGTSRNEQGVDSVATGREILSRLHEEYYGKEEGTPFNVLKSALEKVIAEFKENWGEVEISAMVSLGEVVYSAAGGGGQVLIYRNGMTATIIDSRGGEVACASGYPKENDIIVLSTKELMESISLGIIKSALSALEPQTIAETLAPKVLTLTDSGALGLVVAKFSKEPQREIPTFSAPKQEEGVANQIIMPTKVEVPGFIKNTFNKIKYDVTRKLVGTLPEKRIFIKGGGEEESFSPARKRTALVGILLLAILLVSIGFGIRQKSLKDSRSKYIDRLTTAQSQIEEAITLSSVDESRARELFGNSKSIADALVSEGVKDKDLDELIAKINDNQGIILGEYKLSAETYLDLSILSDGFSGDDIAGSSEKFYVLDKKGKKIVSVVFGTKKTQVVAGPDKVGDAISFLAYEDNTYIINDEGINETGEDTLIEKDWDGEVIPYAYAANIYLLDKTANNIWRYSAAEGGFGSKNSWLAPGITADFSRIKAITIDGSIWTLSDTGKIFKFTRGSPQNMSNTGTVPEITSADSIYTNETLEGVYILDTSGKRVVVLGKDGKYKAQYISDDLSEALDLIISEKDKKIVFLTPGKLQFLEIK